MKQLAWSGVYPAVTTKFTEDDRLDHAEMERCFGLQMDAGCDGIIVAGKAARLSWPTVAMILKTRFGHHQVSQEELDAAKAAFLELSQSAAQRSIRFMQVHEATKLAG